MEGPDPFDVFGGSDTESDEGEHFITSNEKQAQEKARVLRQKANTGNKQNKGNDSQVILSCGEWNSDELPWPAPTFMGSVAVVPCDQVGGGRGMIAKADLPAGTLILIEDPMAQWTSNDVASIDLDLLDLILSDAPDFQKLMHNAEHLHPTKSCIDDTFNDLSVEIQELFSEMHSKYSGNDKMKTMLQLLESQKVKNRDNSQIEASDLCRLLLAIRFNGLESGLYCFTAMLNHADHPNCVKFKGEAYSEIRTTKHVGLGDMLTISYVPQLWSHATRREYLWKHHYFDIGTTLPSNLLAMELVGFSLPDSSTEGTESSSPTARIESTTSDLECILLELKDSLRYDESFALEQAFMELLTAAQAELANENHLLLIPILKLHIDTCDLVQHSPTLSMTNRQSLLCRLARSALKARTLISMIFGPDHFDIASVDLDLAHALEELLHTSPQHLSNLNGLGNAKECRSFIAELWRNHRRIKALYPTEQARVIYETHNLAAPAGDSLQLQ